MQFEKAGPDGEQVVEDALVGAVPVHLAGRLRTIQGAREPGDRCEIGAQALIARCRIGQGKATIIADAALFEREEDSPAGARRGALVRLVDSLARDAAGTGGANRGNTGPARDFAGVAPAEKQGKGHD